MKPSDFNAKSQRRRGAKRSVTINFFASLRLGVFALIICVFLEPACSQTLSVPPRLTNALKGSKFAESIASLDLTNREIKIYEQVALGNVPDFLRKLAPVDVLCTNGGKTNSATYHVTPDYLAIGSDDDYFLTPLTPIAAQKIADLLHCSLPTKKIVDDIYSAAEVKLAPSPIPPSPAMSTVPVFIQHNTTVREQRNKQLKEHPLGALVAGHKKDVVISNRLQEKPGRVAIYGWHKLDGKPIQPLTVVHRDTYADYSHGIRLVQLSATVDGATKSIPEILADPNLASLLSDEGVILNPKYPPVAQSIEFVPPSTNSVRVVLPGFQSAAFDEQIISYTIEPDVKIHINAPTSFAGKKLKLIFYALPNGNTIEQTIGHKIKPGEDWHYDIQHIGAQTRFLRAQIKDASLVVVYLEAAEKSVPLSWPVWRKKHADHPELISQIFESVQSRFTNFDVRVTLASHSGGGSLIFGYLDTVDQIPDDVERIAFLDSNYAYDPKLGHAKKLIEWLRASEQHYLSVLAYNDAVALLNGKTFVTPAGGTWGRSHAMLEDMSELHFTSNTNSGLGLETYTALNGRVQFLLKENPEKKIFHTVQVEKNGFIQTMLGGTSLEGRSYEYFGPRAYTNWIPSQ